MNPNNYDKNMCTVTLSYDKKNKQAVQQLAALLATGLFTQMPEEEEEFPGLDYSDPDLWKEDEDLSLPEDKDSYTPEEVLEFIVNDIRKIYEEDVA